MTTEEKNFSPYGSSATGIRIVGVGGVEMLLLTLNDRSQSGANVNIL